MLTSASNSSRLAFADWALIGGLALLSIAAQGHNFGVGNNAVYISWIWRLGPQQLFLHDWYLNTAPLHPIVIQPLIWLNQFLALDWTFLLAHTLTRLLFCAGVYLLAFWMFGSRAAAILAVVFNILFPRISLGGHFAQASHFEANFLGFALATLAMAFYVKGTLREFRVPGSGFRVSGSGNGANKAAMVVMGIFVGLTLLFHFFIGVYLAAIVGIALLIDVICKKVGARALIVPVVLALVISAPSLWSVAQSVADDEAVLSSADTANILAFRHPHHHAPFTWPARMWLIMCAYAALWLAFLRPRFPSPSHSLELVLVVWTIATCAVFTFFIEIVPFAPVAYFQFFRQTVFFTIFISIYVAAWCVHLAGRPTSGALQTTFDFALAAGLLITFRRPAWFLPVAAAGIVWMLVSRGPRPALDRIDRFDTRALTLPAWGVLAAGVILWLMGGWGLLNPLAAPFRHQPHFARELRASDPDLAEACAWIKANTPRGAVFLVPPDLEEFRILSERAIVADWKTVPFRNAEWREWFDRMARMTGLLRLSGGVPGRSEMPGISDEDYTTAALDLLRHRRYFSADELKKGFDANTEIDIDFLAGRFGAGYVVSRRSFPKPVLFSNHSYFIYQMN